MESTMENKRTAGTRIGGGLELSARQRFLNTMEYKPVDRVPNHEAGVWGQTKDRWEAEGLDRRDLHWDWFTGEAAFGMDPREFIPVHFDMMPWFETKVIERTERYEIFVDHKGITRKALLTGTSGGTRASMDEYIDFPVKCHDDFKRLKDRYLSHATRYPVQWENFMLPAWKNRAHPLILGRNCQMLGYYWRAREWLGTVDLCYAWYDEPEMMHDMMAFVTDLTMRIAEPILAKTDVDYVLLNEDLAMKSAPLLSPATFREFIFPEMQKLVAWFKARGVRYVAIDSDGNCEAVIPQFMEAGVDAIWPLERASDMDPNDLRKKFGRDLRLWGGVDKRELSKDKSSIDAHLATLQPLIEEGGFIPTVDHTVPPDVSLENFRYYMKRKQDLLAGKF
jgi:uroporphyrinogen decarboxylase